MTGRGVDQILRAPCEPRLYEPFVHSALDYVDLAERAHGPIPRPVDHAYVWGDALDGARARRPDVRSSISRRASRRATTPRVEGHQLSDASGERRRAWPRRGIDCCVLANNHVLDWGEAGLLETLDALSAGGIAASAPAALDAGGSARGHRRCERGRCSCSRSAPRPAAFPAIGPPSGDRAPASTSSPTSRTRPRTEIAVRTRQETSAGDVAVVSIHWGPTGASRSRRARQRVRAPADRRRAVDVVYGHSSHHPQGNRGLSATPDPVRMRRPPRRLRGISGHERVSRRSGADVLRRRSMRRRGGSFAPRWCRFRFIACGCGTCRSTIGNGGGACSIASVVGSDVGLSNAARPSSSSGSERRSSTVHSDHVLLGAETWNSSQLDVRSLPKPLQKFLEAGPIVPASRMTNASCVGQPGSFYLDKPGTVNR